MIGRGRNLSEERNKIVFRFRGRSPTRLDRYLRESLGWRSRTRVQRLIREGHVSVNGRVTKPSQVLKSGDQIHVRLSHGTGVPDYRERRLEILYEDPWLLALNKPAGLLVHPVGRHVYDTLINDLHFRYREGMRACPELHPRLCHRIDRDTTGVVLVGKERFVHLSVQAQLQGRKVSKEYLTLVRGHVDPELEHIDRPIAGARDLEGALSGSGLKPSQTRIRVLEHVHHGEEPYSWLSASPITGRQNQIRVHLAAAGHPLVGDERYGGPPAPEAFPPRFLLHARRLVFFHPRLKSRVSIDAPMPADLEALLVRLRRSGSPGYTRPRHEGL